MDEETIVAIATPPGRGGVGIIRLSGPRARAIALHLNGNKSLLPRYATYCSFVHNEELIDQGIMIYFPAPNSFTGEEVVEIQGHGSPVVLDRLTSICIDAGARLARPGEFSERAFLNNKMDLTQAEAVADLIHASSQNAARMALNSLQGVFSARINALNEQITYLRLYVEAAIDFPEEEIDFLNDGKVARLLHEIMTALEQLHHEAHQGVILREGLTLVIAGRPNAGKSTLINHLAGRDIAIVTEIAGTTRDVMREHILLDDIPVYIVDTAGLHESNDIVEQEGIRRAWEEVKKADVVLLVVDSQAAPTYESLQRELQQVVASDVPILLVWNKVDLEQQHLVSEKKEPGILLSAKYGHGIDKLKENIKELIGYQPGEGQFLARRRHLQALNKAKSLLEIGKKQLAEHQAGELLAEDLRLAHLALCEITGEFTPDDLLGLIFSSFCIGK